MTDLFDLGTEPLARISPCGQYRYTLRRSWNPDRLTATFIMLNPSTADAVKDDPTIRRCMDFAKAWGSGGIMVVNLYAYRATKPRELWTVADPVGLRNDDHLAAAASVAAGLSAPLVAAWGVHARRERVAEVLRLPGMETLQALGVTKSGAPRHPLYMPAASVLAPWPGGAS